MNSGHDRTHAVDPRRFRNQATGIGQTVAASAATGAARTARVCACMPAKQRAALPPASGYPAAEGYTSGFTHYPVV